MDQSELSIDTVNQLSYREMLGRPMANRLLRKRSFRITLGAHELRCRFYDKYLPQSKFALHELEGVHAEKTHREL